MGDVHKNIVTAALVVLVVLLTYEVAFRHNQDWKKWWPRREGMTGAPGPTDQWVRAERHPYTAVQNAVGLVRGSPDATDILMQGRPALTAYQRAGAELKPEDLAAAERAAWMLASERDAVAPYNVEKMSDPAEDTMQAHETAPAADWDTMITDLVVDPRTRMNHKLWVDEMQGWSGTTTMKVDTFEPQLYLNWRGLRMPQAGVGQVNPLQLTEVDDTMLAVNKDFRFNS